MPEWLRDSFAQGPHVSVAVLLLRLVLAFLLGCAIAGIYFATHRRDETYQPTFIATLVLLTILIAVVTQVIGDSVARAFSLVGALSIVRFRTVVQDTRDTAFVVFAVVVGMALGCGYLEVAMLGLIVGGLAAFLVRPWRVRANGIVPEWRLTVRIGLGTSPATLEPICRRHLETWRATGVSTSRQGAALDLTYRVRLLPSTVPTALVAELHHAEGVQQVELVEA
jgi:hypothetical protein